MRSTLTTGPKFCDHLSLQPTEALFNIARAMFKQVWDIRSVQAEEALKFIKDQISAIDKQIEAVLTRLMDASNPTVVRAYEGKIEVLERDKLKFDEKLQASTVPRGKFEDFIELSLKFLSSPWKIWESGNMTLRRTTLRLVFSERLAYHRIEGYRTPKTTLPFRALAAFEQGKEDMVRSTRIRSNVELDEFAPDFDTIIEEFERCHEVLKPHAHELRGPRP